MIQAALTKNYVAIDPREEKLRAFLLAHLHIQPEWLD
jgi:hypothetical protein